MIEWQSNEQRLWHSPMQPLLITSIQFEITYIAMHDTRHVRLFSFHNFLRLLQ